MNQRFEKTEWLWIWIIVGFLLSVVAYLGYKVLSQWIEEGFIVQMVAIIILILGLSVLIWWVLQSAATSFSETEIRQRRVLGIRRIRWNEVTRIEDNIRGGLRIHTKQGKIMLFGLVYSNYDGLVRKLREKAKRSGIQWKEVKNFD
ncbi:MAG TPA: hypothetical protein VJ124_26430 [Pyrinomonadaceae bacterium]|nr:hypothetical protein [Pyrinomonadaceae bacterium]